MVDTSLLIILGIPCLYLIVALGVGLWGSRSADQSQSEGYIAGDRKIGLLVLYFILGASALSAFSFLGAPGWAYGRGAAALYILVYVGFGFVPLYVIGPKAARLGKKYGYVTQAELVADRYNSRWLAPLMAIVSIGAFIPYSVLQMRAVGFIFSEASQGLIPFWLAALIPFAIIVIYVFFAGVMGVGLSNVLQGMMMLSLAWILGLYLPFSLYGGIQPMFQEIALEQPTHLLIGQPELHIFEYSSLIVVSILGFVMWPHSFMRVYTSDERTIKKTVALYPTFALMLVPILLVGFAGVMSAPGVEQIDRILPHLITTLEFSPWVVGLFFAATLAAAMSSADSILHAAGSVFARDFVKHGFRDDMDGKQEAWTAKWGMVVIAIISYYFAIVSNVEIVFLLAGAYGAIVQFLPLVIGVFFWEKATKEGAFTGLLAGSLVTVYYTFIAPEPFHIHPGLWGLLVTTTVFTAVSTMTDVENVDHARRFIEDSRPTPIADGGKEESSDKDEE